MTVRLDAIAYALPAGHRWRVAVSPTYWPWVWPSPEPVTLSLFTGGASRLTLPVRPPQPEDATLAPFGAGGRRAAGGDGGAHARRPDARHQRDVATGRSELVAETAEGFRCGSGAM